MVAIPPGQGSDAASVFDPAKLLTPMSPSIVKFFRQYDLRLIKYLLSGLCHLPMVEQFEVLEKVRPVAFPCLVSAVMLVLPPF